MKNVFLYSWLLFTLTICSYGQFVPDLQNNNWVFGTRNSLQFTSSPANSASPVPFAGTMPAFIATINSVSPPSFATEGCATVSDRLGRIIFYTNGLNVYDINNSIVTLPTNLLANVSSAQNIIIVPRPNTNRTFYLFATYGETIQTGIAPPLNTRGLYYSEIDIDSAVNQFPLMNLALQHPNGALIENGNFADGNKSESITSALRTNANEYWVVTYINDIQGSNIYSYRVTENGIVRIPAAAALFPTTAPFPPSGPGTGRCMKISPDGNRIAIATRNGIYIGTFDSGSGTVNLLDYINTGDNFLAYGVEFSQNSNILYYSAQKGYSLTGVSHFLGRKDLVVGTIVENVIPTTERPWGLQRGIDGRVYVANQNQSSLSVINLNDVASNPIASTSIDLDFPTSFGLPQLVLKKTCEQTLTDDADIPPGYSDVNEQRSQTIFLTNTISGPSSAPPLNATRAIYHAGDFIEMLPDNGTNLGFEAEYGSEFVAYIAPCDSGFNYRNANTETNSNQEANKASVTVDKLQIYPNPSNTFVTIALDSDKIRSIVITSIDGKVIQSLNVNSHAEQIDVSNYSKGLYLITVQTEDGRNIVNKFIKN